MSKSIEDYNKAIEIDPKYTFAIKNRDKAKNGKELLEAKEDNAKARLEVKSRDENFYKYIDNKNVGHYTKISNLKHLIKPPNDGNGGLLRLNNVSYMNDPTEGEVFIKLLKQTNIEGIINLIDNLYNMKSTNYREVLDGKNNVFLLSLSSAIDTSLPMWVQYGENGEGCCLVFNSDFFDKDDSTAFVYTSSEETPDNNPTEDYYCLYKIEYVEKNIDDTYKLNDTNSKLFKDICEKLVPFKEDIEKDGQSSIKTIIKNILDQIRFLFKDKDYKYEQEIRLVKFENNGNIKYTTDLEGFIVPHVYINMKKDLHLEEIVLGPKVQNAREISNYLYYTDRVKEVSKSKIKYQ